MRLLDRLRRRRAPDPLAHDTDWHGQVDDVRDELTARRAMRNQLQADRAERGQTSGPPPKEGYTSDGA